MSGKRPVDLANEANSGSADAVAEAAVRRGGLMFTTGRGDRKFTPPLWIDAEAALEAAHVIHDCLAERIATKWRS